MKNKCKRMQIISCILIFILVFTNCNVAEAFAASNRNVSRDNIETQTVQTRQDRSSLKWDIIIKYKDPTKRDKLSKAARKWTKSGRFMQKFYFKRQKIGIYEIGANDNMNSVLEELNEDSSVEYAQPNYPLSVAAVPTDTSFDTQWALYNDGQDVDGFTGRKTVDINAINAWNLTMGDKDVVVGVLDTGVDITHKDLSDNIYINKGEIENNGIDDDGNGYIDDVNGWDFSNDNPTVYDSATDAHGTNVSGVIAASANDGGIIGVAPKVKILPLKFISGSTGYTSDAIEAIEYAKNMGVKIINCSFGGTDNNPALKDAMEKSGMLFICAAGNRGGDTAIKPVYPAAFDINNIISVTTIDSKGLVPAFASYGSDVDVAAPGVSIKSTAPEDKYSFSSGTSISAAVVSGIAALDQSYLPEESISELKERITNNVTECLALEGKVASGGRVDAYASLTGTCQEKDIYTGKSDADDVIPIEGEGETDTWYTMSELARNAERFHYGQGGVNPCSGNYAVTCTDMSIPAPGFTIDISRTYNSRNLRQTLLGRGWTFGFEGKLINKGDYVEISLPNGSSHVFKLQDGKYIGEATRAVFSKAVNGDYILTTQDQYQYGFDKDSNKMLYMQDKNGNRINLEYMDGKLTKITDTAKRIYMLAYNNKDLLASVTDPQDRKVTYAYNADNLLTKVTDPEGGTLTYEYDDSQYLTGQFDQKGYKFQTLKYSHDMGDAENKVIESKDAAGETWSYSYDTAKQSTTITNNNNKKWTYWYNAFMDTVQVQDPEGKSTYTEYAYYEDAKNYFGDVAATIDRNGNRTQYEVDSKTGNTTKITKPDGGVKSFVYDQWNNVIKETNEAGNKTYYIYDSNGRNLVKKAKPLNGTADYIEGNTTDFAVTSYAYYSNSEANLLFACDVAGLLKSQTDPEGNTTTYTYDRYGDTASMKDSAGNTTAYTYNLVGWKLSQTTAKGNKTKWDYDKNGQVIRQTNPDGGVKRYVYDITGKLVLEVNPNLYDASKDNLSTNVYTGVSGTKYEWYDNGYQKAVIDAEGNRTEYFWDEFGNKVKEIKPNSSIYSYKYDALNRLTKTYFRKNATDGETLLSEISYGILDDGKTQITTTAYADTVQKATTVTVKDYAGREVSVQYPDYGRTMTVYNLDGTVGQQTAANGAITYYRYDHLGNQTNTWKPMAVVDGNTMYSWTSNSYDMSGKVITEKTGKSLVNLNQTTDNTFVKTYTYVNGQLKIQTDSEGRKTEYNYDGEGRVSNQTQAISSSENRITQTDYNYLGQVTSTSREVRTGDLSGYDYNNNTAVTLVSTNSYDLDGNLISKKDALENETKYSYDKLDRVIKTVSQLKNTEGTKDVSTSQTYTWDGQVASQTDAKGNATKYDYDAMGNQIKITDALGNITLKYYDLLGRNTAIVSPKNYKVNTALKDMDRTVFTYDAMGRVLTQTEVYHQMDLDRTSFEWKEKPVSVTTLINEYDTLGNVTAAKDALGNTTTTVYNIAGLPEYVTDAETAARSLPFTVRYTYNGLGQKTKEEYPGASYTYTYDSMGNVLKTELDGVTKSFAVYDLLGRKISSADAFGNTVRQEWNALDKLSKTITPGDSTIGSLQTIYQYDKAGNLCYSKNSMGAVTTYTYDSLGRNLSKTQQNEAGDQSITTSSEYDLNGNIVSQTDGNHNISSATYDAMNRVESTTNPLHQKTTYTYDKNGNQTGKVDYLGNLTQKVYDGINRLVETRDAYNNVVQQILYNDANAQVSSFDALHHETKYFYDKNLRNTGTKDGEGNLSSMTYDTRGNVSTKTDANGNTTSYQYDGENHLIKVTDALGNTTAYNYDAVGNVTAQTDGNGNTTTYRYNAANLLISKQDPADTDGNPGNAESYTYYANGKMATKLDRNGITTAYTYDSFGRLLNEDAGGEVQSYTYDSNGNLLTMTDATGTTTRTYDALNRNITKTVPGIGSSTYDYDLPAATQGEYSERTTDPKGNVTFKTYDKVGRLSKVTIANGVTGYKYYANGSQQCITYPDGTTENYSYDKDNRITTLTNAKADGTVISSYHYAYDAAGNQTSKQEAKGTTAYTYDKLNRLSTVTEPDYRVTSYTYDQAGNRKTQKVEKGLLSSITLYTYDSVNRLINTSSSDGTGNIYSYDANGNLISKSLGENQITYPEKLTMEDLPDFGLVIRRDSTYGTGSKNLTTYTYDNYNRLTETKSENTSSSYGYNAQGYRVEKKVNNKVTKYLYESDKVVLETDDNGTQTAYQTYGNSLLYRSVAAGGEHGAEGYYYLYNAHGDVTGLLDAGGTIAATYDYDAFGNILSETGAADNSTKYTGYQYDKESGLYYLNARYYDSVTARFITEDDPSYSKRNDPLSLNLYTYCANNPILYSDPSGHKYFDNKKSISTILEVTGNSSKKSSSSSKKESGSNKTSNSSSKPGSTTSISSDVNKSENIAKPQATEDKIKSWRSPVEGILIPSPQKPSDDVDISINDGANKADSDASTELLCWYIDKECFSSNVDPYARWTGKSDWIPDVLQLDGTCAQEQYLASKLSTLGIPWGQEKVEALWKAVSDINKLYGVQIDPRFLLAIIIQEGTGSFNTSSSNLAADGQNGVETNFAVDVMKANSLVFGKILGFIEFGSDFRQAVASNTDKRGISRSGDIFQYCNWATPIINLNKGTVGTGVYAGDGSWHDGVRAIYEKLAYAGAASDYSSYLSNLDGNIVNKITKGINIPAYNFVASQNAQDSYGNPNGNWTIVGKK